MRMTGRGAEMTERACAVLLTFREAGFGLQGLFRLSLGLLSLRGSADVHGAAFR